MIKDCLLFVILPLIFNTILVKWGHFINFNKKKRDGIQTIHLDEVSRLGGLTLIIFFSTYIFLYQIKLAYLLFISLLIFVPAFLEDVGFEINPFIRFILILLSCFLIVLKFKALPEFNIGFLNSIMNNDIFRVLFFTFALAALINGQNIIDGSNGLSSFTSLISFICLLYIGLEFNDYYLIKISTILIILISCFLVFNYPLGKIFLGDMGSYFLGLISGYLVIETFAKYQNLSSWSAVIILFYPIIEVIFSYIRKKIQGKSPFIADDQHLHLKIFFRLSEMKGNSKLTNALVTPFLCIVWLTPLIFIPISIRIDGSSKILLLLMIAIYFIYYYLVPKSSN